MTIDILIPTRERPQRLFETVFSALTTSDNSIVNYYIYIDEDDEDSRRLCKTVDIVTDYFQVQEKNVFFHIGKQKVLSECWNDLYRLGKGEILMHAADDIIFETHHWDKIVVEHFKKYPISLLYGDDCWQGEKLCTHSFISRKAADAVGYFVPPYFEADGNDVWLQQVYQGLGEYYYDSRIITRHLHRAVDEKYNDSIYEVAVERRKRSDKVWAEKKHLIQDDIVKLRALL